jgi:hypothetical protein
MKRLLLACTILGLTTATTVVAMADAQTDQAVRTFRNVAYSPSKMQTYCQLSAAQEALGEREDEAAEASLEPYLDRLGPDFEAAWETAEEADENSADGKRMAAELEALDNRCPDDGADDGGDDDDGDDAADAAEDADDAADAVGTILDGLGD